VRAVWGYIEGRISDNDRNVSNRFDVAASINQQLGRHAPFWGRPENLVLTLPFRKEVVYRAPEPGGLSEWRQAEQQLQRFKTRPQSVWKLAGAGAVGSQSLVGIPVVAPLRDYGTLRHVGPGHPSTAAAGTAAAAITGQPCLCGCAHFPRGKRFRFMLGHDQRINPATGRRFNAH
jgi:hypothetical protein